MNGWKLWVVICGIIAAALIAANAAQSFTYCSPTGYLTSGNDTWTGTSFDDSCNGGDGNDNMAGKGNGDVLRGGTGSDYLQGDNGADQLHGDGGSNNRLFGNEDDDELWSVNGNTSDVFEGGSGFNVCHGDWNDANGQHDQTAGCDLKYWTHYN